MSADNSVSILSVTPAAACQTPSMFAFRKLRVGILYLTVPKASPSPRLRCCRCRRPRSTRGVAHAPSPKPLAATPSVHSGAGHDIFVPACAISRVFGTEARAHLGSPVKVARADAAAAVAAAALAHGVAHRAIAQTPLRHLEWHAVGTTASLCWPAATWSGGPLPASDPRDPHFTRPAHRASTGRLRVTQGRGVPC